MKKLLIATAAMAMVAGAQAQSSVTVYGVMDVNYTSQETNNKGHNTAQNKNSLGNSRLGFKGTEDLGGGLKAEFQLEADINANTGVIGSSTSTGTFNREAWVGFSSNQLGSVRVGQTDVTSAQAIDNTVSQAADLGKTADLGADKSSTIRYTTPTFAGFTAQVGYSNPAKNTNESSTVGGELTAGSIKSAYVEYVAGPLGVYAGQTQVKVSNTVNDQKNTSFGVKYDFGAFSVGAFQSTADAKDQLNNREIKQTRFTAAAPVPALGAGVKAHVVYFKDSTANDESIIIATDAIEATSGYKLALTKAFSKRTTGYVAYVDQNDAKAGATANDSKAFVVGVNHSF